MTHKQQSGLTITRRHLLTHWVVSVLANTLPTTIRILIQIITTFTRKLVVLADSMVELANSIVEVMDVKLGKTIQIVLLDVLRMQDIRTMLVGTRLNAISVICPRLILVAPALKFLIVMMVPLQPTRTVVILADVF